ncbi:MAG TPA: hypothetical protein VH268_06985 [Solirubrobacterales bacterium]|jgi:hypothetical protein|nr:hypothetical protein [Solirubrobacterales bacterium]
MTERRTSLACIAVFSVLVVLFVTAALLVAASVFFSGAELFLAQHFRRLRIPFDGATDPPYPSSAEIVFVYGAIRIHSRQNPCGAHNRSKRTYLIAIAVGDEGQQVKRGLALPG